MKFVSSNGLRSVISENLWKVEHSSLNISTQWLEKAQMLWVKAAQADLQSEPKYDTIWRAQLGLFEDDKGLLRCKGRLKNATIPYSTQFPLMLPRDHTLTTHLIGQAHEQVFHNGVKKTSTQFHSLY